MSVYRTPLTHADERLQRARAIVRSRDELIARRDLLAAELGKMTVELGGLERYIAERARGFLRLAYRPRQAEDVARHRALVGDIDRKTAELVELTATVVGYAGCLRELAAAREAKHAILVAAGAPTSADLAAIAAQLARHDSEANDLDDAIAACAHTEIPLRQIAALLVDIGPETKAGSRARGLVREAQREAVAMWDWFLRLGLSVSRAQLAERFASLLAYIEVDGRVLEARATTAALVAELMAQVATLHHRSAEIAKRVAALVTERDHLLE